MKQKRRLKKPGQKCFFILNFFYRIGCFYILTYKSRVLKIHKRLINLNQKLALIFKKYLLNWTYLNNHQIKLVYSIYELIVWSNSTINNAQVIILTRFNLKCELNYFKYILTQNIDNISSSLFVMHCIISNFII